MRKLTLLLVAGALVAAPSSLAINDPMIPADECSPAAPAGGHPHPEFTPPNRGIATAEPVTAPVSANNPGASTGARGQEMADPRC